MYFMRIILNGPLSCKTRKLSIYSKFQTEDFTLFLQKLEYEIRFIIVKLKQKKIGIVKKSLYHSLLMTIHQQMVHQCSPSFERYLFLAKSDRANSSASSLVRRRSQITWGGFGQFLIPPLPPVSLGEIFLSLPNQFLTLWNLKHLKSLVINNI